MSKNVKTKKRHEILKEKKANSINMYGNNLFFQLCETIDTIGRNCYITKEERLRRKKINKVAKSKRKFNRNK